MFLVHIFINIVCLSRIYGEFVVFDTTLCGRSAISSDNKTYLHFTNEIVFEVASHTQANSVKLLNLPNVPRILFHNYEHPFYQR
jgi:hypothetical protein